MIKIICIGKIKEDYLKTAILDYKKRINKYMKLEIIELNNVDNLNVSDILKKEGEMILKNIKDKDYVVTLEIDGNSLDSVLLAKNINNVFNTYSNLVFIIGGSYGLDNSVKMRSNYKLSFSKLTFPHQLFRVMLLEQIYRAFKINNNESYHK